MGWERRGNHKYYIRYVVEDDERRRQYCGRGPAADLIAKADVFESQEQIRDQQIERESREFWRCVEGFLLAFVAATDKLVVGAFTTAGYHRHDRGAWRKRHQRLQLTETVMDDTSASADGDVRDPGDLAEQAETAWLDLLSAEDPSLFEHFRGQLMAVRNDLREPRDSSLEKLLIRRIALCQMQAYFADATYAAGLELSLTQAKFLLERQRVTHRRLMQAVQTLAQVRKMRSPRLAIQRSDSPRGT